MKIEESHTLDLESVLDAARSANNGGRSVRVEMERMPGRTEEDVQIRFQMDLPKTHKSGKMLRQYEIPPPTKSKPAKKPTRPEIDSCFPIILRKRTQPKPPPKPKTETLQELTLSKHNVVNALIFAGFKIAKNAKNSTLVSRLESLPTLFDIDDVKHLPKTKDANNVRDVASLGWFHKLKITVIENYHGGNAKIWFLVQNEKSAKDKNSA